MKPNRTVILITTCLHRSSQWPFLCDWNHAVKGYSNILFAYAVFRWWHSTQHSIQIDFSQYGLNQLILWKFMSGIFCGTMSISRIIFWSLIIYCTYIINEGIYFNNVASIRHEIGPSFMLLQVTAPPLNFE